MRWNKNHEVLIKAWIDRLLDQSGLAHIGIPIQESPQGKFLYLITETLEAERQRWLDESQPSELREALEKIETKYKRYIVNIEWDTITNERKGKSKELNDEQIKYYEEFLLDLKSLSS